MLLHRRHARCISLTRLCSKRLLRQFRNLSIEYIVSHHSILPQCSASVFIRVTAVINGRRDFGDRQEAEMSVAGYPVPVANFTLACVDRFDTLQASYDARVHSKYCLVWEGDITDVTEGTIEEVKDTVYLRTNGSRLSDHNMAASVEAAVAEDGTVGDQHVEHINIDTIESTDLVPVEITKKLTVRGKWTSSIGDKPSPRTLELYVVKNNVLDDNIVLSNDFVSAEAPYLVPDRMQIMTLNHSHAKDTICRICLQEFTTTALDHEHTSGTILDPVVHCHKQVKFHRNCLEAIQQTEGRHRRCPCCRKPIELASRMLERLPYVEDLLPSSIPNICGTEMIKTKFRGIDEAFKVVQSTEGGLLATLYIAMWKGCDAQAKSMAKYRGLEIMARVDSRMISKPIFRADGVINESPCSLLVAPWQERRCLSPEEQINYLGLFHERSKILDINYRSLEGLLQSDRTHAALPEQWCEVLCRRTEYLLDEHSRQYGPWENRDNFSSMTSRLSQTLFADMSIQPVLGVGSYDLSSFHYIETEASVEHGECDFARIESAWNSKEQFSRSSKSAIDLFVQNFHDEPKDRAWARRRLYLIHEKLKSLGGSSIEEKRAE